MPQPEKPFLETLYHLRSIEQLILYADKPAISTTEEQAAVDFLEAEYDRECCNYPHQPPLFNKEAALWGAKTLYAAARLFLYRKDEPAELQALIPEFAGNINASTMLSADICLRFLPQVMYELKNIDPDDPLLTVLKKRMEYFHYSAIGGETDIDINTINLNSLKENLCLKQLYLDRIIEYRDKTFLGNQTLMQHLHETLGDHQDHLWPGLII